MFHNTFKFKAFNTRLLIRSRHIWIKTKTSCEWHYNFFYGIQHRKFLEIEEDSFRELLKIKDYALKSFVAFEIKRL